MSSFGHAIPCATLDMQETDIENFVVWHTREHLPERLDVQGFLRGRRFAREAAEPRYLILYDVTSLAILTQPDYIERLNDPTPWTRATLPTFQNGHRSAYQVIARNGQAEGACVMMMQLMPPNPERVKREIELWVMDEGISHPGIVSIAFAIPDKGSSSLDTEESRQSRNRSTDEWVILVEAISETKLLDFVQAEMTQPRCESWGLSTGDLSKIFRHQVRVGQE
ncbi:hypothetical protein VSR34_14125 [Paraburkholderia sp. JHI2823]|uniref:hypothetical protein n=1 Tax=Paraburkholderia TaxID=1822464 RepID=UPI000423B9CE|nr:hypothetical protein [Paraburkholderia mimosarum]